MKTVKNYTTLLVIALLVASFNNNVNSQPLIINSSFTSDNEINPFTGSEVINSETKPGWGLSGQPEFQDEFQTKSYYDYFPPPIVGILLLISLL